MVRNSLLTFYETFFFSVLVDMYDIFGDGGDYEDALYAEDVSGIEKKKRVEGNDLLLICDFILL